MTLRADGWHRVLVPEASYPRNSWEATHISLFLCLKKKRKVDSSPVPLSGEGELSGWLRVLPSSGWQVQGKPPPGDKALLFPGQTCLAACMVGAAGGRSHRRAELPATETSSPVSDLILMEGIL